jgi:D-aspartate ligase
LISFTGKKLRQIPVNGGTTTLGECAGNDLLENMSINFLKAINYSGVIGIDYKYDDRDKLYKILDVNPRICANFRIFVGRNGMDVVRAFYLEKTAQEVPRDVQVEGRKWIVEDRDLLAAYANYKQGTLTPANWIKSLRGVKQGAWFALDDLVPFLMRIWHDLRRQLRRLF